VRCRPLAISIGRHRGEYEVATLSRTDGKPGLFTLAAAIGRGQEFRRASRVHDPQLHHGACWSSCDSCTIFRDYLFFCDQPDLRDATREWHLGAPLLVELWRPILPSAGGKRAWEARWLEQSADQLHARI
jgi:hypothetical protein